MKPDVKLQLLSFCFHICNFIFLALGLSVFGLGMWILFGSVSLLTVLPSDELRVVGAGLLLIGVVVTAVSVVGALGAGRQNRVLLVLYLSVLIVLVLGQLFVTLLLLINRDKIERGLDRAVDQMVLQYGDGSGLETLMDRIQNYEGCCGRTGPSDWLKNSFIQSLNLTRPDLLPCSCFRSTRPAGDSSWCRELNATAPLLNATAPLLSTTAPLLNATAPLFGRGNGTYDEGCKAKVGDWLKENALTIVGMDVALMLVQVLQFVVSVYLYRAVGGSAALKKVEPEDELDHGEQNYAYVDPDDGDTDPAHLAHHHDYPGPVDPAHLAHHHDYPGPVDPAHLAHHHDYPGPVDPAHLAHHHDYPGPVDPAHLAHHHGNQNYS